MRNFFIDFFSQLAEALGFLSSTPTPSMPNDGSQLSLLLQILKATDNSDGDPLVIYPLLEANLDKIDEPFAQVMRNWANTTLLKAKQKQAWSLAADLINFSNLIQEFRLGNTASNLEIAITGYEVAATVFSRKNFSEDWATLQNNLGVAYLQRIKGTKQNNLQKAISHFLAALEVTNCQDYPKEWAETQNNLGTAYCEWIGSQRSEKLETAIQYFSSALEIYTRKSYPKEWAETQSNLGVVYRNRILGETAENLEIAISCYKAALEEFTDEAYRAKWAQTQDNLGTAYLYRIQGKKEENLEKGIECYKAAIQIFNRQKFPEKWAQAQNNLGNIYLYRIRGQKAENLETAISYFSNALDVYTSKDFPDKWGILQNNLGTIYCERILGQKAENLETAISYFSNALKVRTRTKYPEYWADTQNNIGGAYRERILGDKRQNLEIAISYFLASLEVRTYEYFPRHHAETQYNLGITYQEALQFFNAYKSFDTAIKTIEFMRGGIVVGSGTEEYKKKLAEEWNKLYQAMVEVCLELAKDEPQYCNQALEYVERSKSRNLVELLANKDIYPKLDFYPNLELYQTHCHQLEQLRRQIPAKQRELEFLISNRESEERYLDEIEQRRQELIQLQKQRDELSAEINQIDSSFAFTQKVQPIPFSDIQSLTDENTAIVEWYITGNQILAFIITNHHPHPIIVPSEKITALENFVGEYWNYYTQNHSQNTQWIINNLASRLPNLAEILHIDEILSRIDQCFSESGAKCNRLILIPHRYLHLFPLHALPLADGKLLFERLPQGVGYAPSCQLLKQAKDQEQNRPDFTRLFAIQNPTRQPANALLGSQLEIDRIRQHFDLEQSIILKEAEATETNLYKNMEQMRSSHCIHFSCHGKFNPESPLKSALLLADPEGKLEEEANLTLGEVFEKLYLNQCRLVTFSACESGMTDPESISDEYIGLPSGFLYAGSLSVVSTLWSVDPIATTLLIVKFYHNLKRLPQIKTGDVAIALNKAQKWLRTLTHKKWARIQNHPQFQKLVEEAFANSPKRDRNKFKDSLFESLLTDRQPLPFGNPYYWSAFVAIGI